MTPSRSRVAPGARPSEKTDPGSGGVALTPPRYGVSAADAPVQLEAPGDAGVSSARVHEAARRGVSTPGGRLPYFDRISSAFRDHDLGSIVSHTGASATESALAMGASAYATRNHVVFAGSPSLHTVAHEITHVLQQRAGVQLLGGVGEVGDVYERQADAVADQVVRGAPVSGLPSPAGASGGSELVQRLPITTNGGVWDTATYAGWGPGRPDKHSPYGIGVEIDLSFLPGAGSPKGQKIGLIQTVTAVAGAKADPTGYEAVPMSKAGRTIDRDMGDEARTSSPVYGVYNTETSTAKKLTDGLSGAGPNTYGMRNRVGPNKAAKLWDKPSSAIDHSMAISKTFETSAVVLEGKEKGKYLGSVSWGYSRERGSKGPPTLKPFAKVSDGNPSADFFEAATAWNAAGTNGDMPLVSIPIPEEL